MTASPRTGRVVSWATVAVLVLLGGSAATASALTTTPGGPLVHVSVPRGWQAVSYGGLTIDVPASWSVYRRAEVFCGMSGPGVLYGPPRPPGAAPSCPYIRQVAPVIIFGGPDAVSPAGQERSTTINGVAAVESKDTFRSGEVCGGTVPGCEQLWTSEEVVRFPGETVWLDIRVPGRASSPVWGVIAEVVSTVRRG